MDELLVNNLLETSLDPLVKNYVHAAVSDNTRRACRSDLRHFLDWGGTVPASDGVLAEYLAQNAGTLSVATLARRVASISKAHTAKGLPNPVIPTDIMIDS